MRTQYEAVYAALGRLFYAIATSDRHLAANEQRILNDSIKKRWLPLEKSVDKYGTDAAQYIGFAFDTAIAQKMDMEAAFGSFKDALAEHPSLFSEAVKTLTWDTAQAIAVARGGESDAEQRLLARLGQLLHGKSMHA
jgi:hypothetical protein